MANSVSSSRVVRCRGLKTIYAALVITTVLCFTLLYFSHNTGRAPDSSIVLQQQIAQLKERLRHDTMQSHERQRDIASLKQSFDHVLQSGRQSVYLGRGTLWQHRTGEGTNSDLRLPALHHYLPHLIRNFEGLQPSVKIAGTRTGVGVVLGIPTVRRPIESYLIPTLDNLIHNMDDTEKEDALLVVCIAEVDAEYVQEQIREIRNRFQNFLDSGLLEVIVPPESYYPDFNDLKNTLGDPIERVRWRTKQNLDYAYLMMYAQAKGTFYVQLEDDILTKAHYLTIMKNFALKKLRENKDWIILDFCQLGFIGKMFKSVDLSKLVTFFAIFHNDKPVDWLLDHMIQTKVCRFDRDSKDCRKQKDSVWIHYRPSLFQHVGTHSSLKGKLQKLTDKQFGKGVSRFPLQNPKATLKTSLQSYGDHTLGRAYKGETYFWSLTPQKGDNISIYFAPPVLIERYFFRSGCAEHPEAILSEASILVRPALRPEIPDLIPYPASGDNYLAVGEFSEAGVAEGAIVPTVGPVNVLTITIDGPVDHWIALGQMVVEAAPMQESVFNMSKLFSKIPVS